MPTKDDYALAIIGEGQRRGITPRGIVIALATALVESNLVMYANRRDPESLKYPHDALSIDANSVGLFQQRAPWWGTCAARMDPARSAGMFYAVLARYDYNNTAMSPGWYAQQVQQSAFPYRYDERMPQAQALYDRLVNDAAGKATMDRPRYTEIQKMGNSCDPRGGSSVTNFILHTQEGDSSAEALADWLNDPGHGVSYHYTLRDGILVDVVDTDLASWSVLDANPYTINLCFAGSYAGWSRDQWMQRSRDIELAAYVAVQDCRKYGFPVTVIKPPYFRASGISDHRYVTRCLGIGTHVDVGDGFPWDVFETYVAKWAGPLGRIVVSIADDELSKLFPSRSIYRADDSPVDTLAGFVLNIDARTHEDFVERQALRGVPAYVDLVSRVASGPDGDAKTRASAVLAQINGGK